MPTIKGRNVKVEVALTFSAAVAADGVSKAYPPVVSEATHGLANGAVGFFAVADGMVELNSQAFMVNNQASGTFELPGLDSTDYSTWVAGATSTYQMAATWGTLSESAAYAIGGGAATALDDSRLIDIKQRNVNGLLAPQDLTIDVRNQVTNGAAMAFIERKAMRGEPVLFKISQAGTVLRVAYGVPSLPGESVQAGQLASGQFAVTCEGFVVKPNV